MQAGKAPHLAVRFEIPKRKRSAFPGAERRDHCITGPTTYFQDQKDIFEDCARDLRLLEGRPSEVPTEGFYPQYMRTDLVTAFREFFYQTEMERSAPTGYDSFAECKLKPDSTLITFNYDVALERALVKAAKWDIGSCVP